MYILPHCNLNLYQTPIQNYLSSILYVFFGDDVESLRGMCFLPILQSHVDISHTQTRTNVSLHYCNEAPLEFLFCIY